MRTTDDIQDPLARLEQGKDASMPFDELDDAFNEWDEDAPIAQLARGSQAHAIPPMSRTVTLEDPITTAALAKASRQPPVPTTLEEALLALANEIPAPRGC